jgi:hypothetical protein
VSRQRKQAAALIGAEERLADKSFPKGIVHPRIRVSVTRQIGN